MRILTIYNKRTRELFSSLTQHQQKYHIIAPYLGMSVLDIGCGNGTLIPFLPKGASYVGVDINADSISRLRSQYPEYIFYCLNLDRDTLPDSVTSFSLSSIVLSAVIEHLENPDFILDQFQSLMYDTTLLIITTPTAMGDLVSRTFEKIVLRTKGSGVYPHLRHYSRKALVSLSEAHGLICTYYRLLGWHRQNQLAIYRKRLNPEERHV
jgi:2-polyprenyl-3-methyl-5-hydroxy-6-metoxy-1,4-benzoquinol methylase